MLHRTLVVVPLVIASLAVGRPAWADNSAETRAQADALYEKAGKLYDEKRFPEACSALEASLKLDQAYGTLMRLGSCYEVLGRYASAWSSYNDALGLATKNDDKRAKQAAQEAKRLEPLLARVLVEVKAEGRPAGLEIRHNGTLVSAGAWGTPVPVDPGTHSFEARAPGKTDWKTIVEVGKTPGGVTTVRVPVLEDAPQLAPLPETGKPPEATPFWGPQRIAGASVSGAGVVMVAIGSVLGGVTLAQASALKGGLCTPDLSACTQAGLSQHSAAKALGNASTGVLVAGGVVLAAGVVVFATGSSNGTTGTGARVVVGPVAGAGMTGLLVRGGW